MPAHWNRYGRFHTPEAAMRYLARAYNRNDLTALKHVTTADARSRLAATRPVAPSPRRRTGGPSAR